MIKLIPSLFFMILSIGLIFDTPAQRSREEIQADIERLEREKQEQQKRSPDTMAQQSQTIKNQAAENRSSKLYCDLGDGVCTPITLADVNDCRQAGGRPTNVCGGSTTTPSHIQAQAVPSKNILTDSRDGQTYRTVRIGDITWMAQNLNHSTANSWCHYDNVSSCATYGRLYNWNAATVACPAEWRLPSRAEWNDLIRLAGPTSIAGRNLKSRTQWNGTDDFGFSALPGGSRGIYGAFHGESVTGGWWSATESNNGAWGRLMGSRTTDVGEDSVNKSFGFSVRCIKDERP